MLGAVRFIPRDEVPAAAVDVCPRPSYFSPASILLVYDCHGFLNPVAFKTTVFVAVQGSDGERRSEKSSKKRKHGSKEDSYDRKGKSKHRDEKRKHGMKDGQKRKSKHKYSDEEEEEYSSDGTSEDSGIVCVACSRCL